MKNFAFFLSVYWVLCGETSRNVHASPSGTGIVTVISKEHLLLPDRNSFEEKGLDFGTCIISLVGKFVPRFLVTDCKILWFNMQCFNADVADSNSGEGSGGSKHRTTNIIIGASVGGGVPVLCLIVSLLVIVTVWKTNCCTKCRRTTHQERLLNEQVNDRIEEADIERENAEKATNYYLDLVRIRQGVDYGKPNNLQDMGSRVQKYWWSIIPSERETSEAHGTSLLTLTSAPISRYCPLLDDDEEVQTTLFSTLNDLMKKLRQNPFIHPIREIGYLDDRKQVIVIQPFVTSGSLKDMIYRAPPNLDWAEKYLNSPLNSEDEYLKPDENEAPNGCCSGCFRKRRSLNADFPQTNELESDAQARRISESTHHSKTTVSSEIAQTTHSPKPTGRLPGDDISKYGWQILKAMVFLYKQGFPVLGHVHSGNIFVQGGVCRLGGYENTLLGYRSRFYRMCQDHLEHMDVIMFGHLVFEMCCGYELTTVVPTAQDYQAVRGVEGGEKVEEILRYIFELATSSTEGGASEMPSNMDMIKKIKHHEFFRLGKEQMKDKPENVGQKVVKVVRQQVPTIVGGDKVILSSDMKALLARVRRGQPQKPAKLKDQPQTERELVDLSNTQ